jgi:transposase
MHTMARAKMMDNMPPPAAAAEGGRRPTDVAAAGGAPNNPQGLSAPIANPEFPDPEVLLKPERRRFTKAYKLDILNQVEACSGVGHIGALLRREGLYSSYLGSWRLQRSQGLLDNSVTKKRTAKTTNHQAVRVSQLEHENARLKARLRQAELILDIQKKASEILGIPLKTLDNEGSDL